MKINKLKAVSIAICCLVVALWSEAQCMDRQTDILETATVNRTANIQTVSQSKINDLAVESTPSQLIKLEDSQTSWASYLLSPVKATIMVANDYVNLVSNNPKLAILLGLSYAIPVAAAVNCACYGRQIHADGLCHAPVVFYGCRASEYACWQVTSGCWTSCAPDPRLCP
jgi:ABC-type amino acid transport system permease subunit